MPSFQTASLLLLVLVLGLLPAGVLLAESSLDAPPVAEPTDAGPEADPEGARAAEEPEPVEEAEPAAPQPATIPSPVADTPAAERNALTPLVASLTIFVLAVFVGFEVITKVPPTLHTPLMSGSNAISGITLVGALVAAGAGHGHTWATLLGTVAVALATVNVVGGFLVTHRMLQMFRKK